MRLSSMARCAVNAQPGLQPCDGSPSPVAEPGTAPVREEECGPFGRDGLKAGERGFPAPVME